MWILLYPLTFCICLLYNLKGKGLNASSFILLLYFLSSICGVCLHLYHPDYIKIGKILEELEQAISSLDDKEKNKCNIAFYKNGRHW